MTKSLVLGGSGFIGSHLIAALRHQGDHVTGFSQHPPGDVSTGIAGNVSWITGHLSDRGGVADALRGVDTCYHLVSTTLPKDSNENLIYDVQTNVCDTIGVLQAAVAAEVRRFVFISSGGTIYGAPKQVPIEETHALEPNCSYGIGKLAVEHYLRLFNRLYGLNYVVVRLSNPFGPGQDVRRSQGAVAVFLQRVLFDQQIDIWGDGSVIRDYVYVGDAVRGIVAAAHYEGEQRIFNIGSGVGRSLNELISEIEGVVRRQARIRYLPGRSFDVASNILSARLATEVLGYQPLTDFKTGLLLTLEWIRQYSTPLHATGGTSAGISFGKTNEG